MRVGVGQGELRPFLQSDFVEEDLRYVYMALERGCVCGKGEYR